ncbi:transporter [Serratia sp. S1B]|nr:transporter [Serratia sp. S1B]
MNALDNSTFHTQFSTRCRTGLFQSNKLLFVNPILSPFAFTRLSSAISYKGKDMLDIIKIISPIFGIIFLGFAAVSLQLITKEQLKVMGMFVIKIALPCILIVNISAQKIDDLWQPQYLFSYGIVSLVLFVLLLLLYRHHFNQSLDMAALMAMGGSMSNTGFIGGAILNLILGPTAAIYFAMTFIIENFVVFLMFLICLEMNRQQQHILAKIILQTLSNIVKNPIILALILGVGLSATQLALPLILKQILEPVGKTAGPLGLFVVGGSLYGIKSLKNIWCDSSIIFTSKMVLMPILVYLIFLCMPNTNAEMIFAGVFLSSISMVTMFTVFGQTFEMGEKTTAILLMCTISNIITIPIVITLLFPR